MKAHITSATCTHSPVGDGLVLPRAAVVASGGRERLRAVGGSVVRGQCRRHVTTTVGSKTRLFAPSLLLRLVATRLALGAALL